MSETISIQTIPATTFLYDSTRCRHEDVAQALGEILPRVFAWATANHVAMVGPPIVRHTKWGPGMVTLEAGMPVEEGAHADATLHVQILPEGQAAVTVHMGAYDTLRETHAKVEQYLEQEGRRGIGAPREVYITDPGEVPNPDEWRTQIIWPCE